MISLVVSFLLLSLKFLLSSNSSTHALFMKRAIPLLILATIVLFFYLLCLKLERMDWFQTLFDRVGGSLGGKALSFPLRGWGCSCSAGLALTVGFALLTGEGFTNMMAPSGGEGEQSFPLPASSGTSSSDSTAKPSPSALDQRADELLDKNLEALKTALGEGERISEVRETIKENFDVKNPGEEFELIKNMEREVNLNENKCEGEKSIKIQSSLNEVTEKKRECPITKMELNEIKNHEALTQDGKGGGKPTDCSFQEKGKADE